VRVLEIFGSVQIRLGHRKPASFRGLADINVRVGIIMGVGAYMWVFVTVSQD
jgi:hypothetical protein